MKGGTRPITTSPPLVAPQARPTPRPPRRAISGPWSCSDRITMELNAVMEPSDRSMPPLITTMH